MHSSYMIHRDMKLENIMVEIKPCQKEDSCSNITCKITDFGFACMMEKNHKKKTLSIGSPLYMAPDVLSHMYDYKADIWSIGVITYMLLTGEPPFEGKDNDETFTKIRYFPYDK